MSWVRTSLIGSVGLLLSLSACADPCSDPDEKAILEQAAAEPGAIRTESGLIFLLTKPGPGPRPAADNRVQVHYAGRFPDGRVFDSSYKRGHPSSFGLQDVIPGWREGLQLLEGGGKAKLTIPAHLAYGLAGKSPDIPPCATLIFDVELLGIYD